MTRSLIIERLRDWSYGAFLNETDTSCIAIGSTKEEARENGERELLRRKTGATRRSLAEKASDQTSDFEKEYFSK